MPEGGFSGTRLGVKSPVVVLDKQRVDVWSLPDLLVSEVVDKGVHAARPYVRALVVVVGDVEVRVRIAQVLDPELREVQERVQPGDVDIRVAAQVPGRIEQRVRIYAFERRRGEVCRERFLGVLEILADLT